MKKRNVTLLLFFILLLPAALALFFHYYHPKSPITPYTTVHSQNPIFSIQHWVAPNGARVYFVSTEALPIIDIEVQFDAGSARDTKPGISFLCTHSLEKGSRALNAKAIAIQFETVAARYSADVNRDQAAFSLRSLVQTDRLNPALAMFIELLSNPSFPEYDIETLKNQILVEIKKNLQQPKVIAGQVLYHALYPNHPYGHPIIGTEASIPSINKNDLAEFHQQYFTARNAAITIVGGISKEKAQEIAALIDHKLVKGDKAPAIPSVSIAAKASQPEIPFPSEQTHILIGQPCAIENDPDYYTLLVGNYILGASPLSSRLYKEIREKRGLAYSVSSTVLTLQQSAPFILQLQTKNTQSVEALALLQSTLARFIQEGPTEKEVQEAKRGLIGAFPLEISNNSNIMDAVSRIAFYELPLDFLATYQHRVEKVTTAMIKETFQRRIDPKTMAVIMVGPKSQ